jgi:hypothetical protein
MSETIWIALPTGKRVSAAWRHEQPEAYQRLLAASYGLDEPAVCLCLDQEPERRRLSIRKLGSADQPAYTIARYPRSGPEHNARTCGWYELDPTESGRGWYDRGVIRELDDGDVSIVLEHSLAPKSMTRPSSNPRLHPEGIPRRSAMTLRGLLDYLWERTRFEHWWPKSAGNRPWATVAYYIRREAQHIVTGRKRLSDVLIIAAQSADGNPASTSAAALAWNRALKTKGGLLVLGELAGLGEAILGRHPIYLKDAAAYGVSLVADSDTLTTLQHSFARELARAAEPAERVIGLFSVRPQPPILDRPYRYGLVVDGALLRTLEEFIPVASSFEAQVARKLIDEGRSFRKPLRYDGDDLFPDFVLLDVRPRVPMEVFGRSDVAYTTRRDEKIRRYTERYGSA